MRFYRDDVEHLELIEEIGYDTHENKELRFGPLKAPFHQIAASICRLELGVNTEGLVRRGQEAGDLQ